MDNLYSSVRLCQTLKYRPYSSYSLRSGRKGNPRFVIKKKRLWKNQVYSAYTDIGLDVSKWQDNISI